MAEGFAEFPDVLVDDNGIRYHAFACGAEMPDGMWHGWLEFAPFDGSGVIRSDRETTQPNRTDTAYWSTGLTPVYLEGALERALNRPAPIVTRDRRANGGATAPASGGTTPVAHEAILNPFSVYEKGEWLLRSQLAALSPWHLVNIIEAYALSDLPASSLNRLTSPRLVELIVSEVVARAEA